MPQGYGFSVQMGYGTNPGWGTDTILVPFLSFALQFLILLIVFACAAAIIGVLRKDTYAKKPLTHDHHSHQCTNCGQLLEYEWKHCPSCSLPVSSELNPEPIPPASAPTPAKKSRSTRTPRKKKQE